MGKNPARALAVLLGAQLSSATPSSAAGAPWVTITIANQSSRELIRDGDGVADTVRVIREPTARLPSGASTYVDFTIGDDPTRLPYHYELRYRDVDEPDSVVTITWDDFLNMGALATPPRTAGAFSFYGASWVFGSHYVYAISIGDAGPR